MNLRLFLIRKSVPDTFTKFASVPGPQFRSLPLHHCETAELVRPRIRPLEHPHRSVVVRIVAEDVTYFNRVRPHMATEAVTTIPRPVGSRRRDLGLQNQAGRGLKTHAADGGHELVVVPGHLGAHSYPAPAHVGKVAVSMPRTAVPRK